MNQPNHDSIESQFEQELANRATKGSYREELTALKKKLSVLDNKLNKDTNGLSRLWCSLLSAGESEKDMKWDDID